MKKILLTLILVSVFLLSGTVDVFAQGGGGGGGGGGSNTNRVQLNLPNPFSGGDSLFALLRTIINDILLPIGGMLAVLSFIYSGFLYVTAQGNEAKLATAHKALLYTSVGTALLLGAWVFASVICQTIGAIGGPICPT